MQKICADSAYGLTVAHFLGYPTMLSELFLLFGTATWREGYTVNLYKR
jgi:hypothetical protein